jgi:hypothetical protein
VADYTIRVEADTRDSQDKVDKLDKRLNEVERTRKIDIQLPSLQQSVDGVKSLGEALKTAFNAARMIPGNPINELEDVGTILGEQAKKVAAAASLISKATPTNILGNSFSVASEGAVALSKNVANLGYTVFGVTQSVNILKSAFGGFFEETIGREIKLQETLLRTKTTLVSTADVAVNGKRITDPYEAILKLERPIEKTVNNIRLRSLDIAGTTSDAIIQTFGVVAGQIGQIGGSMKDAEDLAISFAGALGTLGLSDPMYATQEIRSILTGNIDQNSILARSLGLTNEEVAKAKKSADGLVAYLQKRLEAFTAGQSIAAKGFAGIVSNIQEVQQELSRVFGKPFLQPLLDGLTKVYERLQLVTASLKKTRDGNPLPGPAVGIADALGRTGNAVVSGVAGAAMQAPSLTKVTQRVQYEGFERLEKLLADVFLKVQAAIDKMRPQITLLAEEAVRAGTEIVKGLSALAAGFAQFKFENFKYLLTGWIGFAKLLNDTVVPAVSNLLKVYGALLSNDLFQNLTQFTTQWSILEKAGILPAVRGIISLHSAITSLWPLISKIPSLFQWIGTTIAGAFERIVAGIAGASAAFTAFGKGLIEVVVLASRWLMTLAVVVSRDIGLALVQLAAWIRRVVPELVGLANGVASIGRAFLSLAAVIPAAQVEIAKFAIRSSEFLASVELSVEKLKAKFAELGATIQSGLGAAKNTFMGFIGGIVRFFAIQLAIQAAITLAFDAMQRYNQGQQEIADKTRAELAIRRLSTAYKDLGDNATLAARKAKEFEDSIVSNRLSDVTKKIEELSARMREIEPVGKGVKNAGNLLTRLGLVFNPSSFGYTGEQLNSTVTDQERKNKTYVSLATKVARLEQARLGSERKQLAQEAQTLLKYQEKADSEKQSKEQVDILGKERKQLEREIADYRKQLNKEITDNEFNFRQERLQIEQTAREAQRASESAALGRSIEQNLAGLSGFRRQFAEILGNYQKRLFDAQTESQKRQFDLARQKEKLEKNLADYKLRLEEQTFKLRQKMTDYSVKMTKWENEERIKASQVVLQNAMKAGAAAAGRFVMLPDDRENFLTSAKKEKVSAQRLLTLIKMLPGAPSSLSFNEALSGVRAQFPGIDSFIKTGRGAMSDAEFLQAARIYGKDKLQQSTAADFAFKSSGEELNSNFWKKYTPAPPPKAPGIESLLADNARATKSYQENQNAIIATTQKLYELQDALARQQIEQERLASITRYFNEGMRTAVMIQDDQRAANDQLTLQRNALVQGNRYVDPYQALQSENRRRFEVALDEVFKSLQGRAITFTRTQLISAYSDHTQGKTVIEPSMIKTAADRDLYNTLRFAVDRFQEDRYNKGAERNLQATVASSKILTDLNNLISSFENESLSIIQKIQEVLLPNDVVQRRQFQAQVQIDAARRTPEYAQLATNADYVKNFNLFASAVQLSATKLGQLDKAIEAFAVKIALIKDTASTLTEGFKSTFMAALNGQIKDFSEMMSTIRDKFTTAFTDWIFRPIQESIEKELRRWFNVDNEAAQLAEMQKLYTEQFKTAVEQFATAVSTFSGQPKTPPTPAPGTSPAPTPEPAPPAGPTSSATSTAALTPSAVGTATTASANFNALSTSISNLSETAKKAPTGIQQTTENLQSFLGGMATVAAGIAGIVAGIQQLGSKKGGTAGTLMGLSNIFIGLGTTLIGGGKLFKAAGGPVSAGSPYVVGEQGPEWFVPSRSGNILPNGVGLGGGGGPVNSVVNVHINDSGARTDNNQASQLGRMIDSAVVNIINRERRPGGLLTAR